MTLSLCCNDPTLDELLDDDLTQTVMQADRVDAVFASDHAAGRGD